MARILVETTHLLNSKIRRLSLDISVRILQNAMGVYIPANVEI